MPARLLIAHATSARQDAAREWLAGRSGGERLVLAPSRGAADDLLRQPELWADGLMGVHRLTLMRYAALLAAEPMAGRQLAALSTLGEEALAARVAHRAASENRLEYFTPVVSLPGFPRALAATLRELRLERVEAAQLEAVGPPGADLALLLAAFVEQLEAQQLADRASLLELARSAVRQGPSSLVGSPLLLFDTVPRNRLETGLLAALAAESPEILATAPRADRPGLERLQELLGCSAEQLDEGRPSTKLDRVRRALFSTPGAETVSEAGFEFFSAAGEGREAVEVARSVLARAAEGTGFDRMAVFVRNPELYQPQLQDAFRRAKIPAFFSRGTRRPDPVGRAFLALLACALERLSATRFAEYLSLGQVPAVDDEGAPRQGPVPWVEPPSEQQLTFVTPPEPASEEPAQGELDPDAPVIDGNLKAPLYWEALLVDASVIGGRDRWQRRLEGLQRELEVKLEGVPEEDWHQERLRGQLSRLAHLKAFALPVVAALDELPSEALWGQWLERLRELAALSLRRPESVLEVLAELQPMERVGPVGLSEVHETLRNRLSLLRSEPPRHPYGRVFVGAAEEAAGRSFSVVFAPGLSEGVFPRQAGEDPLLLDAARRRIDPELKTRRSRTEEERRLLGGIVESARDHLFASYSRLDLAQGRGRVPSLYALELVRSAEGALPELEELERSAMGRASRRLGWPAPRRPEQAVDAAEFDLATLRPILEGAEPPDGRGRFLLEVNPVLARSLRVRYKRWLPGWTDVDGIVAVRQPEVIAALEDQRLRSRSYSPTALQSFATCPFKFFLYALVRLQPREEAIAIERMDPLLRGSLFHDVQFELFRHWKEAARLPLEEARLDELLADCDEILARVARSYAERVAPALPTVWEGEIHSMRVDLRSWIRELVQAGGRWEPIHFEYAFGLVAGRERDPASVAEPARLENGMLLRGSIDLVELDADRDTLRVTDHKTGRAPRPEPRYVGGGAVLQPLIYALAAERLLGLSTEEGRLYYCTQRGGFRQYVIPADREARQRLLEVLETVDGSIEHGFLPAAPQEGACRWCDYRAVCGPYEELRAARKDPAPMGAIEQIRRIP